MSNTIDASFGLDLSPLKAGWKQAAAISRAGAAQVASVMKQSLAKTTSSGWPTPGQVSPVNMPAPFRTGASFRTAPPGKYMSPAQQEAEEASGGRGGLPRGIRGLGVLTAVYQLESAYGRAVEAAVKLREANRSIFEQTGGGTAVALGELEKKLTDVHDVNKTINDQKAFENQPGFLGEVVGGGAKLWRKLVRSSLGGGNFAEQDASDAKDAEQRRKSGENAVTAMAAKQRELNSIEREGFSGDEEKADLMKAELNNRERLLQIATLEARAGLTGHSANADAENERFKNEGVAIKERFSLKQAEVEVESRLNSLKHEGATADEQSLAAIKEKIGLIDRELQGGVSKQRRETLAVQRGALTDELGDTGLNRFLKVRSDPGLLQREANQKDQRERDQREFNRAGGFLSPHFDMSGKVIGGVDPFSGNNVNLATDPFSDGTFGKKIGMKGDPTPAAAQQALTKADMEAIMAKYWGGN